MLDSQKAVLEYLKMAREIISKAELGGYNEWDREIKVAQMIQLEEMNELYWRHHETNHD